MTFHEPELAAAFAEVVQRRNIPAGEVLMEPGDRITHIPIVARGSLRILARNENGQERFLYHILPGESCAASLTCCVGERSSNVLAIVEEDAELLLVPIRYMDTWMVYPEWRRFVNDVQAQRFQELLEAFTSVAFSKLDEQLWTYLLKRAQAIGDPVLKLTHQGIAHELGSPREVITRLLNQLQAKGRVELARGTITVFMGA